MSGNHLSDRPGGVQSSVRMTGREVMALYLLLRRDEDRLDEELLSLFGRIEELLFSKLSIDEMERIDDLYRSGVDVFDAGAGDDASRA